MKGNFYLSLREKRHFCSSSSNAKTTVKQNTIHTSKFTFSTHQITDLYKACNICQSGSVLRALLSD